MAKAAAKSWSPVQPPPATPVAAPVPQLLALGDGPVTWADSPARQLHARLAATFVAPPPPADDLLSPRAKLAIMVGSTAFLWAVVAMLVALIR